MKHACLYFGISRTLYYRWQKKYLELGLEGLENISPQKPTMPNQVDKKTEKAILEQVIKTPKDGPRQICYTLNQHGTMIGETGVYNVMKRFGLNHREDRIAYARQQAKKKRSLRQLSKLDIKLKMEENQFPGFLIMETLRERQLAKGYGKLYFYALYDVYSKWGMIHLFKDKHSINLAELNAQKIDPLMKTFNIKVMNVISEQLPVFQDYWDRRWQPGNVGIRTFKKSNMWELTSNDMEILKPINQFIESIFAAMELSLEEQYRTGAFVGKLSIDILETQLIEALKQYNFKQTDHGRPPVEYVMNYLREQGIDPETLPLWVYLRMV